MLYKYQIKQHKRLNDCLMPAKTKDAIFNRFTEVNDLPTDLLLKNKGIYYITGLIEEDTLLEYHQDVVLKHLNTSWKSDIQIIINSPGGSLVEGWPFIDLLQWVKMDVRTVGMGEICSLGAMLLASGTKGKRFATVNSSIMIHNFWTSVSGHYNDIIANMKTIEDENKRMLTFWKTHSKYKTNEEIQKNLLKAVDCWLTPEEAIQHGIIDGIAK